MHFGLDRRDFGYVLGLRGSWESKSLRITKKQLKSSAVNRKNMFRVNQHTCNAIKNQVLIEFFFLSYY